jgi:uncharacterized protein
MKLILQNNNTYVLRAVIGEDIMKAVRQFCVEQNIQAAWFSAIGAAKEVNIAKYNIHKKEYESKELGQELEIVNILGNVTLKDGEQFVHAHGTFSDEEMRTYGGHINKAVVGVTGEILLEKLEGRIERMYDQETGLNLMQ